MRRYLFIGPVLLIILWWVITEFNVVNPLFLPSPKDTFIRVFLLFSSYEKWKDIFYTFYRWASGYFLGCIVGIPIGILMGYSLRVYKSLEFLIDFFRSLPVTAMFPLFLLVFGIGDSSKIAMTFTATVFIVTLNSAYGVIQTKKTRIKAAKTFGASEFQIFKNVVIFEALPHTLIGMRTTLSLSLIVVIVSEMFIGTQYGLGQRIYDAYTRNSVDELYAIIIFLGFIGYLSNKIFMEIEGRIAFWAGK